MATRRPVLPPAVVTRRHRRRSPPPPPLSVPVAAAADNGHRCQENARHADLWAASPPAAAALAPVAWRRRRWRPRCSSPQRRWWSKRRRCPASVSAAPRRRGSPRCVHATPDSLECPPAEKVRILGGTGGGGNIYHRLSRPAPSPARPHRPE